MNRYFRYSIFIVLAILIQSISAQNTFQADYPNYGRWLTRYGSNTPSAGNLLEYSSSSNYKIEIGGSSQVGGTIERILFQWNISNTQIPEDSPIISATIHLGFDDVNSSDCNIKIFNVDKDISSGSLNATELWNLTDCSLQGIGTASGSIYVENGKIEQTFSGASDPFIIALTNALKQHRFTIGVAWINECSSNQDLRWKIYPEYISLTINYGPVITLDQLLSDDSTRAGTIGRWNGTSFPTPRLSPGATITTKVGSTEVLQGDQNIYSGEKYNHWETNFGMLNDVTNHHVFQVKGEDNKYISKFKPVYSGITIKNNLLETGSNPENTQVEFSDPWLIDQPDPSYANTMRNQGTTAPFRAQASPFSPDQASSYNGYVYKGLFLNQDIIGSSAHYSVRIPSGQIVNIGGVNHSLYFQNWSATGATLQDPNSSQSALVFNSSSAVVTGNMKGSLLSSSTNTFQNTSQRKFIRTPDGSLHLVYESLGYVWYERSSDGGSTWVLMNGGKPLSSEPSRSPSIDYCGGSSEGYIGIVFQEKGPGSEYEGALKYYSLHYSGTNYSSYGLQVIEYMYNEQYDTFDASPVIAFGSQSPYFLVAWKGQSGLLTRYFDGNTSGNIQPLSSTAIVSSITDSQSEHPFIVTDKQGNSGFHLAWEENLSSSSGAIRYCRLNAGTQVSVVSGSYCSDVSLGSGFTKNSMPVMISVSDRTVRMTWLGQTSLGRKADVFRGTLPSDLSWNTRFWSFGNSVSSQSINLGSDGYFLLFSDYISGQYRNQFTDSRTLSNIYTLNTTGRDLQINNDAGGSSSKMYAMTLNSESSALPYSFSKSNSIGSYYGLNKTLSDADQISSRGIILQKDSLEYYFHLLNISSDGRPVRFITLSDTLKIKGTVDEMNKFLVTEPFSLTDTSALLYTTQSGISDSTLKTEDKAICAKVELIDKSGKVLAELSRMTSSLSSGHKKDSYRINMQGLGNKEVRMRLTVDNKTDARCFILESHYLSENGELSKSALEYEVKDFSGNLSIKEFSLQQNYPNPFNPSTVISYELPKASKVSLKVYDVLGKEVANLVNDYKPEGRYSVEFNASQSLSSGIYIYELRTNDFVSIKKMMLMK